MSTQPLQTTNASKTHMASNKTQDSEDAYEETHVHKVYEQIASHFSSTRYKPWPIVEKFLLSLPAGAIGIDTGCGNGKYLSVRNDVFILASDRSSNLLAFASRYEPHATFLADALSLPHRHGSVDFALSIAVVHHLSTRKRRVDAVRAIIETLKPDGQGKCLIFAWALEQKGSRRGWDQGHEQDVMVPWVMKGGAGKTQKEKQKKMHGDKDGKGEGEDENTEDKTFHRYYHLYREGELGDDIVAAGGEVVEAGYEKDNWWAIARRKS